MKYICWGADAEDLTPKVEAERKERSGVGPLSVDAREGHQWKVLVTCKKGHENVFTGTSE